MKDRHPERETLEKFFAGELTDEEDRVLQRHLFTCAGCEERLIELLPLSGRAAVPPLSPAPDPVHRTLIRRIVQEAQPAPRRPDLSAERAQAARLWRELQSHEPERRRLLVRQDRAY